MHWSFSSVAIVAPLLFLNACGGGGDSNPSDNSSPTLLSAGTSPQTVLIVGGDLSRTYNVDANSTRSVMLGTRASTESNTANFDLLTSMSTQNDVAVLEINTIIQSYEPSIEQPVGTELITRQQQFDKHGMLLESTGFDSTGLFDASTFSLLDIPPLVLATPENSVGVNARWKFTRSVGDNTYTTNVTVTSVSATQVSVNATSELSSLNANLTRYESSNTAAYSLPSLLLESAQIDTTIEFSGTSVINQSDVPVSGSIRNQRTIQSTPL